MEPLALGLDSDADAAARPPREPAGVAADAPRPAIVDDVDAIDWTVPPYTVGGLVRLVLEHEDPAAITPAEMDRRLGARQRQIMRKARSVWDLDFTDYRRAVRAVFDTPPYGSPPK